MCLYDKEQQTIVTLRDDVSYTDKVTPFIPMVGNYSKMIINKALMASAGDISGLFKENNISIYITDTGFPLGTPEAFHGP